MPHGPRLGPVWEQSTEYLDPGPQQASDFAAPLPRGTTFYQLQAWAPSSKSGRKVLGAQQRVLSWMGTHSVLMAGMGPPTALDPPSVGMGGAGGPSSPRSISRWPAGPGLGASTRESAGCRHSLQACLPLRGAVVDSICSQVWQGRLIMSEV